MIRKSDYLMYDYPATNNNYGFYSEPVDFPIYANSIICPSSSDLQGYKQNTQKMIYNKQQNRTDSKYIFGLWGLVMHLAFLWGVLDINFHSPIIQGLPVVPMVNDPPARRLLLFVADGLRYRTFVEYPPSYLRHIMNEKGSWGISRTRIPTESRPGNVAIAAGLYEDPSAIFRGWKENPVDFDSVFNQSRKTWVWGSPDIVSIFTKDSKGNIYGESYPSAWQDFDPTRKSLRLDEWVFDKYLRWLETEANIVKNSNRTILYFHLLGCDTTGHSAKPVSKEYIENMKYVDQRIEETVRANENFFGNGSTTYLFTADHGMTDWGSHGSGSLDETETPFVAWGAGIANIKNRQDIQQADISPLISSLIGIPIPVNSEGILPVNYLDNQTYAGYALLSNIEQLRHQIEGNQRINCEGKYQHSESYATRLNDGISKINKYLMGGKISNGVGEGIKVSKMAKDVLSMVRRHHRARFLIYLSIMWIGWITSLFLKITGTRREKVKIHLLWCINVIFGITLLVLSIGHKLSDCNNWRLPFYAAFAILSLWSAMQNVITFVPVFIVWNTKRTWTEIGGTIVLVLTMFLGLMDRWALSIGMLFSAFMQQMLLKDMPPLMFWSGLVLVIFPLLPVVEPQPRIYVVLLSIFVAALLILLQSLSKHRRIMEITRLSASALIYLRIVDGRYWMSWMLLITTPLSIWTYPTNVKERTHGIVLGLFCPLVLLSASYEPFFFLVLAIHLLQWPPSVVQSKKNPGENLLTTADLIKAAFFTLYTLLSFFGTGNIASISSFDPLWTRHFITVFSPFVMTSLILFKLSIPLILIGCVNDVLSSRNIILAILLLGNCLSLPLVYYVTPEGSWLDIGSAISRFTIAITLPCLLLLLKCISWPLMKFHFKGLELDVCSKKSHIV